MLPSPVARSTQEDRNPLLERASVEAAEGIRTLDLLHGKQLLTRPERLEMPANQRIRGQNAGDGIPGIAARWQGFRQGNDNEAVVDHLATSTARPLRARRGQVARPDGCSSADARVDLRRPDDRRRHARPAAPPQHRPPDRLRELPDARPPRPSRAAASRLESMRAAQSANWLSSNRGGEGGSARPRLRSRNRVQANEREPAAGAGSQRSAAAPSGGGTPTRGCAPACASRCGRRRRGRP